MCVGRGCNAESLNRRQEKFSGGGAMVVDDSYRTCPKRNRSLSSVDLCHTVNNHPTCSASITLNFQ